MNNPRTRKEGTMLNLDKYAVFATDANGKTWRVSDPVATYDAALQVWAPLDADHRAGLLPHARHYEVRSVGLGPDRPLVGPEVRSHDRYDRAPLSFALAARVASRRGYAKVENAARAAWLAFTPTYSTARNGGSGVQGLGGWYYWPNGRTAAQGLWGLARLVRSRQMVVQGVNGRWFPVAS